MTPLERILRAQIAQSGPISIADYMALCLTHPEHGYYVTRDPLGAKGDFITAPEVSQMFGEMIGLWLAQVWLDQGRPDFVLAELGPGRGTLMADILRVTRGVSGFHEALDLWLVEVGAELRKAQGNALAAHSPHWTTSVTDLPEGKPVFVIANEFLDALPIHQFQRDGANWRERMVGLEGDALTIGLSPPAPMPALDGAGDGVADGTILEVCPAGEAVMAEVARRMSGGAALFVDYGDWDGTGDTLQALRAHQPVNPLATPGTCDLTAHVRFQPLARAAQPLRHSFTNQGEYLERLGITARAEALAAKGDFDSIAGQHRRLTHPEEMGKLFKVLAITPETAPTPPGFA